MPNYIANDLNALALSRAASISAACEAYRRADINLKSLRRRAEDALNAGIAPVLDEEIALNWLKKNGCSEFLGGGSFGQVYRMTLKNEDSKKSHEVAVKWIAAYPSVYNIAGNVLHEYEHHKAFAKLGLAWMPLGLVNADAASKKRLSTSPQKALVKNVAGILMPILDATLDQKIKKLGTSVLSEDLGLRLVELLRKALEAGVAHNDLKANNIGIKGNEVRFIDFGKALSCHYLKALDVKDRWLLLEEATLADTLRLCGSLKHLAKDMDYPVLQPLRNFAKLLINQIPELQALFDEEEKEAVQKITKRIRERMISLRDIHQLDS